MANEKFLNQTGLAYYHDRAKTKFENKIEKVYVNSTEVPIVNKVAYINTAEMDITGDYNEVGAKVTLTNEGNGSTNNTFTITKTTDGASIEAMHDDGMPDGFKVDVPSKEYVDTNGGKIDKIKVNGTEQTITNKEVDLPITVEEAIAGGDTATGNDKKIKIQNSSVGTIYAEHGVSEFNAVSISKNGGTVSSEKKASHSTNGITVSFRDYDADTNTHTTLGYEGISISHVIDPEGSDPVSPAYFNLVINKNTGTPNVSMSASVKEAFRTQLGIASAFTYKGSVATEADLPATGNTVGDVYDVQESGMNFAWDGTKWDALGSYVDTSLYWAKSELTAITTAEIDALFA